MNIRRAQEIGPNRELCLLACSRCRNLAQLSQRTSWGALVAQVEHDWLLCQKLRRPLQQGADIISEHDPRVRLFRAIFGQVLAVGVTNGLAMQLQGRASDM